MKRGNRPPPENCPNCGEDVPRKALACPGCGSDYDTGWSEESQYDGVGLPDEEFDYVAFTKREFGHDPRPAGLNTRRWIAALVVFLLATFALIFIFH